MVEMATMIRNELQWVTYSGFEQNGGPQPVRTRASKVPERRRAEELGFRGEICASEGQKMAYSWFKTSLTSRRAGPRRDVTESRIAHVATWQRA